MSKKLVVVAGGTGGHIFPGIAVAAILKASKAGPPPPPPPPPIEWKRNVVPKHDIDIDFITCQRRAW